jgi:hypothetical protein
MISLQSIAQADTSDNIKTINTWAQEQSIIADTSNLDTMITRAQAAQLYLNIAKQQW